MKTSILLLLLLATATIASSDVWDVEGRRLARSRAWYQAEWKRKQEAAKRAAAAKRGPAKKDRAYYVAKWEAEQRKKNGGGSKPAAAAAPSHNASPSAPQNPPQATIARNACQHGVPKKGGYCQCVYETDKPGGYPVPKTITKPYYDDAIRLRVNGQKIVGVTITDPLGGGCRKHAAHRDAIQLIPTMKGVSNFQFIGGIMSDVTISNNKIRSQAKLQGVFASDGLFSNLIITNNMIDTPSAHKVTINGFLSGKIQGNKNSKGQLAHVELGPCRIGGNFFTGNVWILGFHSSERHQYNPVSQVIGDSSKAHVVDKRTTVQRPNDCNIVSFQVTKFHNTMKTMDLNTLKRTVPGINNKFNKWMQNLGQARGKEGASQQRISKIRQAWSQEGSSKLISMRSQDVRNFALQELAKTLGSPKDRSKC